MEVENFIIELVNNSLFADFKYIKSRKELVCSKKSFEKTIKLYTHVSIDKEELGFLVRPVFGCRIKAIHNYLSPYYQGGQVVDYERANTAIGFPHIDSLNNNLFPIYPEDYFFPKVNSDFYKNDDNLFYEMILNRGLPFMDRYSTVENIYTFKTKKILNGIIEFGGGGIWIFEQLLIVKICEPDELPRFVRYLYSYQKNLFENGEPNAIDYFHLFDEIVAHIEEFPGIEV